MRGFNREAPLRAKEIIFVGQASRLSPFLVFD
jgi:hypothetical protein